MALCPNYGMTSRDLIVKQWFPAEFQLNCPFRVKLTTVLSPSNFWVQIDDPEHRGALQRLERNMTDFYKSYKQFYRFESTEPFTRNTFGVIKFGNDFRRVIVCSFRPMNGELHIIVFHIDYGLLSSVLLPDIYKIHHKFAYFPQQAIWATLADIVPLTGGTHWDLNAQFGFTNIIQKSIVTAKIVGIYKEKLKLHLVLEKIDAFGEVNVNDTLVNKGLAQPGATINIDT